MPPATDHPAPRAGSHLHYAVLSTGSRQAVSRAWVQWWHDVSRIPVDVSDPTVADRKLVWWQQAVSDAFDAPPQHPLLRALAGPQGRLDGPPRAVWLEQLEGLRLLTQQTRWLDTALLAHHAEQTTGAAAEGWARLLGASEPRTHQVARDMGVALRWGHILLRLAQDTRKGWLHIPIDHLQAHDVRAHELLRPASDTTPPAIAALLDAWKQETDRRWRAAESAATGLDRVERRALRPLVVLGRLQSALLDDLAGQNYPVLHQRITLGPWRKLWISQLTTWRW